MTKDTLTLGKLLGDFRLLLFLFVGLRLVLLIAYQPFLLDGQERGVGVGGDRAYHYALTSLIDQDLYPFRDWWSEFPPLWYSVTSAVYVGLGANATYDNWSLLLGLLMLAVEAGNLALVRALGARLHGTATGQALAWVYALCAAPLVFMWWNFDALVTFFALFALWAWLRGGDKWAIAGVTLGAFTKFVPFLLFGAFVRFAAPRRAAVLIGGALGAFVLLYLPFFALNSDFAWISLTAQFNKPSYQTVWALLDGNYTTGNFGTVASHLTAAGVTDGVADKQPPRIPNMLRLGGALLLGLVVFWRVRRLDGLGAVAFFAITLCIFYLQSQGWSPQWLTLIIPLLLLVFPNRDGVLVTLMLTLLAFMEYPFLFVRTGDSGGVMLPEHPLFGMWVLLVLARTLLLAAVCVALYRKLRQQPNPELALG